MYNGIWVSGLSAGMQEMAQVHWPTELLMLKNAQHPHYPRTGALFPAADSLAEYSSIRCVNCGCEGETLFWCLGHLLFLIVIASSMSLNFSASQSSVIHCGALEYSLVAGT